MAAAAPAEAGGAAASVAGDGADGELSRLARGDTPEGMADEEVRKATYQAKEQSGLADMERAKGEGERDSAEAVRQAESAERQAVGDVERATDVETATRDAEKAARDEGRRAASDVTSPQQELEREQQRMTDSPAILDESRATVEAGQRDIAQTASEPEHHLNAAQGEARAEVGRSERSIDSQGDRAGDAVASEPQATATDTRSTLDGRARAARDAGEDPDRAVRRKLDEELDE